MVTCECEYFNKRFVVLIGEFWTEQQVLFLTLKLNSMVVHIVNDDNNLCWLSVNQTTKEQLA